MTDLPTLKIGCGIKWVTQYENMLRCVKEKGLCPTCQHNLDAVKAHAAAYEKNRKTSNHDIGYYQAEAARDAVLEIAGLDKKDL